MSITDIKALLFDWGVPILIGIVAYFLRQMAQDLRSVSHDITEIKETVIKHGVTMEALERRVDKIESKLDN